MTRIVIKLAMVLVAFTAAYLFNSNISAGDVKHNSRCGQRYARCLEKCNAKIDFLENRLCSNECWEEYQWCLGD